MTRSIHQNLPAPREPLNFRKRARRRRGPTVEEARLICDVVFVLNAAGAQGMSTSDVLLLLTDPAGDRQLAKSPLPDMAKRGWFGHVAVQGEPVTRYGKQVRPWLWYAEDQLPRAPEPAPGIDALARLKALAKEYVEFAPSLGEACEMMERAIEGIEP